LGGLEEEDDDEKADKSDDADDEDDDKKDVANVDEKKTDTTTSESSTSSSSSSSDDSKQAEEIKAKFGKTMYKLDGDAIVALLDTKPKGVKRGKPATEAQIAKVEKALGCTLPPVSALYQLHHCPHLDCCRH
jgi:hypothetical protein